MLTRLTVSGFKNLVDVDVRLGAFTCIAGGNGCGKSNLFDAILFLSALTVTPLLDAALSVRGERDSTGDPRRSLFHRAGSHTCDEMRFMAEMIVARTGVDDLGQRAEATSTFLRYALRFGWHEESETAPARLEILEERLDYVTAGDASDHLPFSKSGDWQKSVIFNRRRGPGYISTEVAKNGIKHIKLHQEGIGGRPRYHIASDLPRTVLSSVNAVESPTALLARREMQSWRRLQLEPAALRRADSYRDAAFIGSDGAHLPKTLSRLIGRRLGGNGAVTEVTSRESAAVTARVANRLAELVDTVSSIRVDDDPRRELLTLMLTERGGTELPARSLSDGTLRILALAIMENDPEVQGTLCLEEPENGIHPDRIPAMLALLQSLTTDVEYAVGPENPLRQVIVNTHSPVVVANVPDDSLLAATLAPQKCGDATCSTVRLEWLPDTWRWRSDRSVPTMPKGRLVAYLNPVVPTGNDDTSAEPSLFGNSRRVADRPDLQPFLPFGERNTA